MKEQETKMKRQDYYSIVNNWNDFLEENRIEENFSLQVEKILAENPVFISNENLLNSEYNYKNNNLHEAGWLPIIGTGVLVLPTIVKIIYAAIDAIRDKNVTLKEKLIEAFNEDFGHQAIPVEKVREKKNSMILKAAKYILALNIVDEPIHTHSKRNIGKEYIIVYGNNMSTEEKDKAIEDYEKLHDEEHEWSRFRKIITKICHIIHHAVQGITEFVPRLLMKAFNTVTRTEHSETKEVVISILGNIICLIGVIYLIGHALHAIPTLAAAKAGSEAVITTGHILELAIEGIEVMMELSILSKSVIKIWNSSKSYLKNSSVFEFVKNLCEGGKLKVKGFFKFIKSLFEDEGVECTESSRDQSLSSKETSTS